jgi:hypothetical protein
VSDTTLFTPAIVARFETKLTEGPGGCWLFTGYIKPNGYGQFYPRKGLPTLSHRWSYEYHVDPIPDGLVIDHLCRVRHCVNPAHLEAVDQRTNVLRGVSVVARRAAATACIHGHPFTEANTYITTKGGRGCRECGRRADRERYWRMKVTRTSKELG